MSHEQVAPGRPAPMVVQPATLTGRSVRLEPLARQHLPDLRVAGLSEPGVFRWYIDPVTTAEELEAWFSAALAEAAQRSSLPFATIDRATGRAVGSSRYLNIDAVHHRLEIGSTWLAPWLRGTGHNSEAKLLQLDHAFGVLGAMRVEFKTDSRNEPSRAALLAIGATFEGIFRHHMIVADGRHRHSAYYSIVAQEWPEVRRLLTARLERQLAGRAASRGDQGGRSGDLEDAVTDLSSR